MSDCNKLSMLLNTIRAAQTNSIWKCNQRAVILIITLKLFHDNNKYYYGFGGWEFVHSLCFLFLSFLFFSPSLFRWFVFFVWFRCWHRASSSIQRNWKVGARLVWFFSFFLSFFLFSFLTKKMSNKKLKIQTNSIQNIPFLLCIWYIDRENHIKLSMLQTMNRNISFRCKSLNWTNSGGGGGGGRSRQLFAYILVSMSISMCVIVYCFIQIDRT